MSLLKGHQIIGELRLIFLHKMNLQSELKGHQIIGELRQIAGQLPLSVDVYIVVIPSNATYFLIIYQQVIVVQLSAYFSSSANCKNFCSVQFCNFIFL